MQTRLLRFGSLGLVLLMGLGLAGCHKKVDPKEAEAQKQEAERKAELDKADEWMVKGTYVTDQPEWKGKIMKAIEGTEALDNFRLGLYTEEQGTLLEYDGEINGENAHFRFNRNRSEEPSEFFLIGDRYYNQRGNGVQDNGENSREIGEKLFKPLMVEIRINLKMILRGEIKDLGPAVFEGTPVHKYDLRIQMPGSTPEVLTAMVEIDEARSLLLHAIMGVGTGSTTSPKRFGKSFREIVYAEIGKLPVVEIPKDVPILPVEDDPAAEKLGLR